MLYTIRQYNLPRTSTRRTPIRTSGDSGQETPRVWQPRMDMAENKAGYILRLDMPGMDKHDIHITFENNTLAITGERKFNNETGDGVCHHSECAYGSYARRVTLPRRIDSAGIDAHYENGVLRLFIPRAAEAQPRHIEVQPAE